MKNSRKFKNTNLRAQWWDYAWTGAYFITICTQNRLPFFGDIVEGDATTKTACAKLSALGQIASDIWDAIPHQFPYAKLDAFVVMPNHIHGILIITEEQKTTNQVEPDSDTKKLGGGFSGSKNPMLHQNVSRIIRWYKGRVSFEARKINPDFAWQSLFYDRIIRNDEEYNRITAYIQNNPAKWHEDDLYQK